MHEMTALSEADDTVRASQSFGYSCLAHGLIGLESFDYWTISSALIIVTS